MNRLAHWMMRLYPARWRRRYGDELDALLADTGADVRIVADLLRGGVRMRFSVQSFRQAALGLGLAGLLIAGLGSLLLPNMYVSHATVQVQQPEEVMSRLEPLVLSRITLSAIINDPRLLLYTKDLENTPLEDVIENMRRSIWIDVVTLPGNPSPSALNIAFKYPDARKAQMTLAALIDKFRETSDEQHLRSKSSERATRPLLDVIDIPDLPAAPVHSNAWLIALSGALIGVSSAIGLQRLRNRPFAKRTFIISAFALGMLGFIGSVLFVDYYRNNGGQYLIRDQWRSTALMSAQNMTPERLQAFVTQALNRTSLARIVNDPRLLLYRGELKTRPLEDVIQEMRRHLKVAAVNRNTHYFSISFEYPDRFKVMLTVQALMNAIDAANYAGVAGLPYAPAPVSVNWRQPSVQSAPSLDLNPVAPNRPVIAAMGGGAGLLFAAIIALFRNRWEPAEEIPAEAVNG